ncbi:MAG TPA: antibiotic biosynthesis monooxygenase [Burkholderiales bacterium]
MHRYLRFFLAVAVVPVSAGVQAQATAEVYVATYVEVIASAAGDAAALLRQYRDATRKDEGNLRAEVVQEVNRPNRFAVMAIWADPKAFEAHGKSAHTAQFRAGLKAIQAAPYDERVHTGMFVGAKSAGGAGALFVLTHVDVPPPLKDTLIPMLKQLSEDARKGAGNQRYEVQQQNSRPNHFTVVEAWANPKAYEAFVGAATKRQFRETFGPMTGALYDERLYGELK